MTTLRFDVRGASEAGDHRHPREIMESLGIALTTSKANPIADNWIFTTESVPDNLPPFIEQIPN